MRRLFLTLICCLWVSLSFAQTTISGVVRDRKTLQPVESANVMLQDKERHFMFAYSITDADGTYSLEYKGKADTLCVVVTGFNMQETNRLVTARTQRLDFAVESSTMKIREVVVNAPPVTRRSDTLTYNVSSYRSVDDHSIGDVLKKMPGIEVAKSGEVKYNGKTINKFYIEGLDMLEGRYGIATNNVRAQDIAKVEVFENHQPIKLLENIRSTDQSAINLKLKEDAKGTWNATMQLGAGYKPWMWNAEATAMFFGRGFQTIDTYKTNNTGDDIERELTSFYNEMDNAYSMLGVHEPTPPPLDNSRYLNNNVHTVSLNTITKLKKDLEFTANAHYIHDYRTARGSSITTYYLPEQSSLVINEHTYITDRTDRTEVSLQLKANTDKRFLLENVTFAGRWDSDYGEVLNSDEQVTQRFRLPRITFRNVFSEIHRFGDFTVNFNSNTSYNSQPTYLSIKPTLHPEIFDNPQGFPDAKQTLDSRKFRTVNSTFAAYTVKRWTFMVNVGVNAQIEWMNSALAPADAEGIVLPAVDTMRNDVYWRKLDVVAGPSIGYKIGEKFSTNLYVPFDFMSLRMEDKVAGKTKSENSVLFTPMFNLTAALTYNLKFSARASYYETLGDLYDTYSGYIMSDYRMISSKSGDFSRNKMQNYSASLAYANAIQSLFGSVDASYWHSRRNLMYGTVYVGTLSRIESYPIGNDAIGYNLSARVSKRFDGIGTTINLSGGFARSWAQVLRQEQLMQTSYDMTMVGIGFNTRFTQAVRLEYKAEFLRSQSAIEGQESLAPINSLRQDAAVNFIIKKQFICRVGGEHYYNGAIEGRDRNMFFLDASLSYKTKRIEYSVEARNLLDTGTFNSAAYSDITNYVYSYQLRPASVMFKIKFSLR